MKKETSEWLEFADADAGLAGLAIAEGDYVNNAASLCQQAIEKYFKAYLLENNWNLEKTHNLIRLYEEISKIKKFNINEQLIKRISSAYNAARYPGEQHNLTKKEVRVFCDFAKEIGNKIKRELGVKVEMQPDLDLE